MDPTFSSVSSSAAPPPTSWSGRMFDHITLRVADLPTTSTAVKAALDQLEVPQTRSTTSVSVWGNFALTQSDHEHPIARRVHIGFIAPTRTHVDRFAQAGIDAGFTDDGAAGPRPDYADDYYAAYLKDAAGNSFERSEEHTSELQSRRDLVCRLLLEKKKNAYSIRIELATHMRLDL